MFENHRVEAKLGAQKRNDFQMRNQAVRMSQRNVCMRFLPVHSNVPQFDLHVEGNNVEAANLRAPPSEPLDFGDHPLAHVGLKRLSSGVPDRGQQSHQAESNHQEQKFPPARRPGSLLNHRVCTPSPAPLPPGTLTLLSERKDCNHETSSSLTLSCVSNSRILAATSAGGISGATDGFNCGTNFSR